MSTSPTTAGLASMPAPLAKSAAKKAAIALYTIVLVSGAVLMGVEIAGAKILAPGFGTSTFVWGSIIGLFMAALATGYYVGGNLADMKPSFSILAGIVTVAGVWITLIPRLGPDICETIARSNIGPIGGPLLASFAVFFVPSVLMGMVSPYAVKLNASSLSGLGGVAGRLYALSTFGSIVGTLATTFFLIPSFKLSNVMQALGVMLVLCAFFSFALFRSATSGMTGSRERTGIAALALVALFCVESWVVFPVAPHVVEGQSLLHYDDSTYHEILVTDETLRRVKKEDSGTYGFDGYVLLPARVWNPAPRDNPWWLGDVRRWLKFNENIESGIYPYRDTHSNAVTYTDLLHIPVLWVNDPPPKKVLVVGGGGGIIPAQYFNWYGSEVTVAEIDPKVETAARDYFQVPKTDKINFIIGDGRQIVRSLKDKEFDIIFLDAYSSGGQIPFHLMTWEFLNEVKAKLSDRGVLVTNIISGVRNVSTTKPPRPADLFLAEYKTLRASRAQKDEVQSSNPEDNAPLFNQVYVFPKVYETRPLIGEAMEEYRNVIVIATREEKPRSIDSLVESARAMSKGENPAIKAEKLVWNVEHLYDKGPKDEELERVPILRDDYAPLDTMYRPVKRDEGTRRIY